MKQPVFQNHQLPTENSGSIIEAIDVERGEVPGIVTGVCRHGEVHVDAVGNTSLDGPDSVLVMPYEVSKSGPQTCALAPSGERWDTRSWKTASHLACFIGVLSIEGREREVRMSSPDVISTIMYVSQEYHQNQIVLSVSIELCKNRLFIVLI